jgi:hypothetical protein
MSVVDGKEVDEASAPRRLADARQPLAAGDGIERTLFAGFGTAGKRNLRTLVWRQVRGVLSAQAKTGLAQDISQ